MIGVTSVFGLYLPTLMVLAGLALLALWGLRQVLARLGVYRWVWHPALFDLAVYVLLLSGISSVAAKLSPLIV